MLADVVPMMCMADVMLNVAGAIPLWQMLLPHSSVGKCGRWNATVAGVVATILLQTLCDMWLVFMS